MKIKIIYVSKKDLKEFLHNPRQQIDTNTIEKLRKLIRDHGFQNPLQVYHEKDKYLILCGNHRFRAGIAEGIKEFPCIVYHGDKKKAIARAISDNKSGEWTEWYFPKLKDLFVELDTGEFDIESTGFKTDEIKDIFDYERKAKLEEKELTIDNNRNSMIYFLVSFPIEKILDMQPIIDQLKSLDYIQYEQTEVKINESQN